MELEYIILLAFVIALLLFLRWYKRHKMDTKSQQKGFEGGEQGNPVRLPEKHENGQEPLTDHLYLTMESCINRLKEREQDPETRQIVISYLIEYFTNWLVEKKCYSEPNIDYFDFLILEFLVDWLVEHENDLEPHFENIRFLTAEFLVDWVEVNCIEESEGDYEPHIESLRIETGELAIKWLTKRKHELEIKQENSETLKKELDVVFIMTGESYYKNVIHRSLRTGDMVELKALRDNKKDPLAIAVMKNDLQIGWYGRVSPKKEEVYELLSYKKTIHAEVFQTAPILIRVRYIPTEQTMEDIIPQNIFGKTNPNQDIKNKKDEL
jgi:hypothetical protein